MVSHAHEHGIRIFLDVIEHGVMADSPLVQQHPHWFRGKSWGMVDFDFDLHDPELDNWWVGVWTYFIVECGVDGLRIDLGMRRPDLYQRIRDNAANAGREILLMNELNHEGAMMFATQSELTTLPPREAYLQVIDVIQRDPVTLLSPHSKRPDEVNGQIGYATVWELDHWQHWLESVLGRANRNEQPAWAYSSGQISSHDNGWEGFPRENPFTAQGSRFIFGYGSLFSSLVPIFVAGEEFDAPFVPHPSLSPFLFGGADPGKGKWLYGNVLAWDVIHEKSHAEILSDVQRLLAIRHAERDVLGAIANDQPLNMRPLDFTSHIPTQTPYMRWNKDKIVVVAGTTRADTPITITVNVPLTAIGWSQEGMFRVTNLWTEVTQILSADELQALSLNVAPDKTPQGGLALVKIERA
jgi:hypothetical protein